MSFRLHLLAAMVALMIGSGSLPRHFVTAAPSMRPTAHRTAGVATETAPQITLNRIGRYSTGSYDIAATEIVSYDPASKRMFIVNNGNRLIDVVDISDPASPVRSTTIPFTDYAPNSVAVRDGIVAIAAEDATTKTNPGRVLFYSSGGTFLTSVTVGALPDMLTFTPDGAHVLVANEGEPSLYPSTETTDPVGSVSIIAMPVGGAGSITTTTTLNVSTAGFTDFNVGGPRHAELSAQIRIFGPGASVAQDLEPEYIAVSPDSSTAYVTLQENNALAIIDIADASVTTLVPLGFKSHSLAGNGLDPSDSDGGNAIANWPVYGMYQPDSIDAYTVGGQTYLVTANEGDARDYTGFAEERRVGHKDYVLDTTVFTNADALKTSDHLGRLNVTTTLGDTGGDGDFDQIYTFGARSFSIWSSSGALVYDSGDDIEQRTAAAYPSSFNADNTNNTRDNRSDNKGPEPEALDLATIGGRTYAFVGLERMGGIMVYDVTNPAAPTFLEYKVGRGFTQAPGAGTPDDLGPEGISYVPASQSPNGKPLLLVANEISGSVTIYQIDTLVPAMSVAKTDGVAEIAASGALTYTISYQNTNSEPTSRPAMGVVISDTLPSSVTYVSCSAAGMGTCSQSGGVVTFNLAESVAPGASGALAVTVTVKPDATGTITNSVTLSYADGAAAQPQASASDTTAILVPPPRLTYLPLVAR